MNDVSRPSPAWKLPRALQGSIRERLIRAGAEVKEDSEKQWRVKLPVSMGGATVTLHRTGTCTVAGKASAIGVATEMIRCTICESDEMAFLEGLLTNPQVTLPEGSHIGSDESGKSDFFGPLVTAAVHADGELIKRFCSLGIRDCKDLTDASVLRLAEEIHRVAEGGVAVTCLHPEAYNDLYRSYKRKGKTLNDLLAWAHARCIKKLLGSGFRPTSVLVDRFAYSPIKTLAKATQGKVPVLEVYTAEADFAVAAASIVARAKYLEWMDATSHSLGTVLPKGTSNHGKVVKVARSIVERDGPERLTALAKMNVKTISEVLGPESSGELF